MESWKSPEIAKLPGKAPVPHIFDTAAQLKVELPFEDQASLYVCGITPYDATHMGHASTYVAFDVLNRAWRDAGMDVAYVQNVTDVDDPLLERANATGVDWCELAKDQTELFFGDMEALNVIAPDHYVGAVESIEWIVPTVERWIEQGIAYRVPGFTDENGVVAPDGDVYFDVEAAQRLGEGDERGWHLGDVSNLNREQMLPVFAERGGDPQRPGKKDVLDPLLWRVEREGEPAWDGKSLGRGRPGWHIECTMISQQFLPAPFTVQGGGSDLQFPHHEMGAAHAYAVNRVPMAQHFAHTGMVGLDGEKMSKSLGNLVLVSKLRAAGVHPGVIRLAIMSNHYRTDWFWTNELLAQAQSRFGAISQAVTAAAGEDDGAARELIEDVRQLLADDLNTPVALDRIEQWAQQGHAGGGSLVADLLDARFGVKL